MEDNNEIRTEKIKIQLQFKYTGWLFIIDQLIRFFLLIIYIKGYLNFTFFLVVQIFLIFILIFFNNKYLEKLKEKYSPFINKKYEKEVIELTFEENIPELLIAYQLLFGFIFSFWIIYHDYDDVHWYSYLFILFASIFGASLCMFPLFLSIRYKQSAGIFSAKTLKIKETFSKKNIVENVSKNYPDVFISDSLIGYGSIEFDAVDANDIRIARIESETKNINYKSEAWMLESVFLGGLSFSGFLTVASANFIDRETIEFRKFLEHIYNYFNICGVDNIMSWFTELENQFFRNDFYILIMLLCLLSSVFFFLVLVLRFRLSSMALNMDHLIRILIIFNSKEEELFNLKLENDTELFQIHRLEKIQRKIDTALIDAEKLIKELQPTSIMMSVYRTIAIFLFYLVLIVSGFYFMPVISILIFFLFIFTQLFGFIEKYSKLDRIKHLLGKH